jgi:putative ABC transport system permease protein
MIVGEIWRRLVFFFRREQFNRDLAEEMEHHVEMKAEARGREGLSPKDARHAARREFGNTLSLRDRSHDAWGWVAIETLLQDLRYGSRMLRRSPGFTVVAVLTLALGIGANTAIFSAVNGILLQPLVYPHSPRLVTSDLISLPEFRAIQKQSSAFEDMAFYQGYVPLILGGGAPVHASSSYVSAEFFPLLGMKPLLGRYLLPGDTQPGSAPVAVLSYQLWMGELGGDPHIIRRKISVDQKPYVVVGVMPKGFDLGADWLGTSSEEGLWTPWIYPPPSKTDMWVDMGPHNQFVARLRRGVTIDQANAQLKVISAHLAAQRPKTERGRTLNVASVRDQMVRTERAGLLILFGAVGFLLLLACINVSSLLVARSWTRQQELAIRKALGATRRRILRQLLSESLLLALAGGALGLLLSVWGIHLLRVMSPPYTPRVDRIRLDSSVLWFTMGISLIAAVLVGLAPALQVTSPRAGGTLKGGLSGSFAGLGMRRTHHLRSALVVLQVLLAVVVVVGAALMGRSFYKLMSLDTGVQASHVITMHVELSDLVCFGGKDTAMKCPQASENMLDGIRSLPGVQRVALALGGPLQGGWVTAGFHYPGGPRDLGLYVEGYGRRQLLPSGVVSRSVTPGFFAALGIRILKGRDFEPQDLNSQRVAIVSQGFAREYIPGNPLGKEFSILEDKKGHQQWMEIVGVVNDVRDRAVKEFAPGPVFYTPFSFGNNWCEIIARTSANPLVLVPGFERVVRSVDKEAAITNIRTVDQIIAQSSAEPKFQTLLLGSFGTLGLLLAIIGVYGVISYSVVQRTHEIGVRMALGARRADVLRMVLRQGMLLATAGIVMGIGGALALTRVLRNFLFEIKPTDPATFVGVAISLTIAALAACYIPARRAMKVDPMVALRYE